VSSNVCCTLVSKGSTKEGQLLTKLIWNRGLLSPYIFYCTFRYKEREQLILIYLTMFCELQRDNAIITILQHTTRFETPAHFTEGFYLNYSLKLQLDKNKRLLIFFHSQYKISATDEDYHFDW